MAIRELVDDPDRRDAVPILQQLWTDREEEDVLRWTGADDYHLFGEFADGELVGVAGVLESRLLHHAHLAWLYDLVVDESHRGRGYGTKLVTYIEEWSRERGCEYVALASPLSKEPVHEYYEELDYTRWGYVIEKEL